ncbi:MAG: DUF6973 domain-containing protein [Bacteroidia bacterium]
MIIKNLKTFVLLVLIFVPVYSNCYYQTFAISEFVALDHLISIKKWSIEKAKQYFAGQMGGGEKGDAYRHVLASVLSRKVLGKTIAANAGVVNELLRDLRKTNTPRDRFMDLHNNKVGRVTCYKDLIGKTDDETAQKVLDFFKQPGSLILMNWGGMPPDTKRARQESKEKAYATKVILY